MVWQRLVVDAAGNTQAVMGLGPSPEAASCARGEAGNIADRGRPNSSIVVLGILTDIKGIATGNLRDGERVAQAVGAFSECGLTQLEQTVDAGKLVPVRYNRSRAIRRIRLTQGIDIGVAGRAIVGQAVTRAICLEWSPVRVSRDITTSRRVGGRRAKKSADHLRRPRVVRSGEVVVIE